MVRMSARTWDGARRRGVVAVLVLTRVALSSVPIFSGTPAGGVVSYTLYGDAGRGWGSMPSNINSPGPTLVAAQGEMVHLDLFSADGATHTWCIDYNTNNACEAGENESAQFFAGTPAAHMFFATGAPGTYHYVCGIHGGITMWGLFRITAAVTPVVTVSSPAGGERWTGGTPPSLGWTMQDPHHPITSFRGWGNYSTLG